jgi:iron complex transport system ATP-binding protein
VIELDGVALAYGGCRILEDVSFTVRAGEVLALVGPNGVGKSTLLRAIAGARPIDAGRITFEGRAIGTFAPRERSQNIALIEAEGPPPEGLLVDDVVAAGRLPHRPWWRWTSTDGDRHAVDGAIARTNLAPLRNRPFAELSSGERQRVWIAMAVAQRARAFLLDEPTSHLDIKHTFETLALARRLAHEDGGAVVVVLHDLNVAAAFADRIALLGERTLLACDTAATVFDEALLARVYGIPIAVRHEPGGRVLAFAVPPKRGRA